MKHAGDRSVGAVLGLMVLPALLAAQTTTTDLGEAFELERRGSYQLAALRYGDILQRSPANLSVSKRDDGLTAATDRERTTQYSTPRRRTRGCAMVPSPFGPNAEPL